MAVIELLNLPGIYRGHRDDDGFTLPELMVVVLIIGILLAIALPTFWAPGGGVRIVPPSRGSALAWRRR